MFRHNFHTHTHYCDGSSAPEAYILHALDTGMQSVGFSGHAPVPFKNSFAIANHGKLKEYCHETKALSEKYRGQIDVYLGLEADFIPGKSSAFSDFSEQYPLDYMIGAVHLVLDNNNALWFIDGPERKFWLKGLEEGFGGDIRKAVKAYYRQLNRMIETQDFDIVAHLDKVKMHNRNEFFREEEAWYRSLLLETLEVIRQQGCIVEINTRGLYKNRSDDYFPGSMVIREMQRMNIPVTISTDAHRPQEMALLVNDAEELLIESGYREAYRLDSGKWIPEPL
jgi:histidinol-phosphatase (PHP family)